MFQETEYGTVNTCVADMKMWGSLATISNLLRKGNEY